MNTLFNMQQKRISVAPMMDWTTREFRAFARLFNPHIWLYSEMVSTNALLHGDQAHLLDFDASEQPLVLQLGGADPKDLSTCSKIAEDWGYAEVNLNVGCPSDRVQHNKIGACLMAEPQLVADCVHAMQTAVSIPITVKHRIGIDHLNSYEHMLHFVDTVASAGCKHFIVHARIALLNGLSPKENRHIPPLRYTDVYRLKQERPELFIEINGGITTLEQTVTQLDHVDGVMLGRSAYHDTYLLAQLSILWQKTPVDRLALLDAFYPYMVQRMACGVPMHHLTRHMLGLFQHVPGARGWRQALSGNNTKTIEHIKTAADKIHNSSITHGCNIPYA